MKKLFKRFRKEKRVVPKMPEWNELVEMLYNKNLEFLDSTVEKVIYSKDKSKRYVVLKSDKGFFNYRFQKIYQYTEEEWSYSSNFDIIPGFWQEADNKNISLFSSFEDALNELEQEAEYKIHCF